MKNRFESVVLASASPRRRELLKLIFDDFEICVSDCDETINDNLPIFKQPEYLACLKGSAVSKKYNNNLVIAADTCVFLEDMLLGKPKDREEAFYMLKSLSGKTHKVITGCALFYKDIVKSFSAVTEVEFYQLSDNEIFEYIATGEPFDKAGGYGIQSKGGLFVKELRGDYFNVVGLPIAELKKQIQNM